MATPLTISVLTPLQCAILKRIAEGASRPEIAKERGTSAKTTEYHCAQIMKRLGLETVAELTQWALAMGLTTLKFKNETPDITLELLAKIHAARMEENRPTFLGGVQDPLAPCVKKVLKNPEPPVVVDPAGEDAWSEEIFPAPKDTILTAEPVRGQRENVVMLDVALLVPAQEQKPVEPPIIPVIVTAQEPKVLTFKPDGSAHKQVRKQKYKAPKVERAKDDKYLGLLSGPIDPNDDKYMECNPSSWNFEARV